MRNKNCINCGRIIGEKEHKCPDRTWNKGLKGVQVAWNRGLSKEKQPNFGKPHSEATKQKMKSSWTDEKRKVVSQRMEGNSFALGNHYNHTEEAKKKLSEAKRGEKSYQWKGGISPTNTRIRLGYEFRRWREKVFKRDNHTCQKYGYRGQRGVGHRVILHPHHILNFSDHPTLRFDVSNGITLSKQAHDEFHKKYSFRNNTREQVNEFLL